MSREKVQTGERRILTGSHFGGLGQEMQNERQFFYAM